MGNITLNLNYQNMIIMDFLKDRIILLGDEKPSTLHTYGKVFLNGNWIGLTKNFIQLAMDLRKIRMNGEIEKTVGIVLDFQQKEVRIYTDSGRLFRPLLRVEDNKLVLSKKHLEDTSVKTWNEFMIKYPDVIEYVDVEESLYIMLADYIQSVRKNHLIMTRVPDENDEEEKMRRINRYDDNVFVRYTHCEFHPSMMLGIVSSNIPFPNHNQSPRGIFQYSQARQAMGLSTTDYRYRTDITYVLYHPQTPIVASRNAKYTHTNVLPAGENVIVAIMSYTGLMVSSCHRKNCGKSTL